MKTNTNKITLFSIISVLLISCEKNHSSALESNIKWEECKKIDNHKNEMIAHCGKVTVPLNWNNPTAKKMELNIIKVNAKSTKDRIGVLLVNPGGPGTSPHELVTFLSSTPLNLKFDIIGLEPRGFGKVKCNPHLHLNFTPKNAVEFYTMRDKNTQYFHSCFENSGEIINHLETKQAAQDINAVRELLGEKQLNFYGLSYGANVGATFAELFPKHVRSMVLDSVFDQTMDIGTMIKTQSITAERVYNKFLAWCMTDEKCALKNIPELKKYLINLFHSADKQLAKTQLEGILTSLYHFQWEYFAKSISEYKITSKDNYNLIDINNLNLITSITCPDIKNTNLSWEEYLKLRTYSEENFTLGARYSMALDTYFVCSAWNLPNKNLKFNFKIEKNLPVLIINSSNDAITPKEWAEHLLRQIPAGKIVYSNNIGHLIGFRSHCTKEIIFNYFENLVKPQNGITCD